MLTKHDKLLIYFLLLLGALTFLASTYWTSTLGKETKKVIVTNGKATKEYSLANGQKKVFSVAGCVVEITQTRVRVRASSCPKKICVAQGWIEEAGETIVCLPHQVMIKVVGDEREAPFYSLVR